MPIDPSDTDARPADRRGFLQAGAVGAPPAIMNAVLDALSARGVTAIDMPATPDRVFAAIRAAQAKAAA